MAQAAGILEVYGLVAAFVAGDAGCKAANVTLEPFDRNKPGHPETLKVPLLVVVKFRGSVSEVTAAVEAAEKAAYLTPVPGGVGQMTIAMLLSNTLDAAERDGR